MPENLLLVCTAKQQAVQRDCLWLERVELDLGQTAVVDFAPTIDAGLGFFLDDSAQGNEELLRIVAIGDFTIVRPRERFDGVTAKKLCPIFIEKIFGSEDVAPGDFAAVCDHNADNAFVLEAGGFFCKAALDFFHKGIDVAADAFRFVVELVVGLGRRFVNNRVRERFAGNAWRGCSRTAATACA